MRELYGDKKMALVVIDAQRKFRSDRPDWDQVRDAAVTRMNRLLFMFRQAGAPVIVVRYEGKTRCRPYEGTDGDEYFPGLVILPTDRVVTKHSMNSFRDTELEGVLKSMDVDKILLCGTVTQYCVMSTYYSAMDHDITPYLAHDATISTTQDILKAAEVVCKTLEEDYVAEVLGVPQIPDGEVPVVVPNVVADWDSGLIPVIAALANSKGGHFMVGYPKGVKDNVKLARSIIEQVKEELGIEIETEAITFCAHDSVDVTVRAMENPVVLGGQKFTARLGYGY